jgi:MoxR-like ATPase
MVDGDAPGSAKYPAAKYRYTRDFDPLVGLLTPNREQAMVGGDHPEDSPYHYDEEIILAVNAALAANRPLLIAGPPGTGKSALAANIAQQQGWDYEAKVITGRTEGRDLLWRFDAVRRLRDAQVAGSSRRLLEPGAEPTRDVLEDEERYIEPGVLWKAFAKSHEGKRVVVLIDEIDKADPDVPNSLLEVLGNGRFTVDETGTAVSVNPAAPPFIVITTNDERELSRPFRRRCVTLTLPPPTADRLEEIARRWSLADGTDGELARALAKEIEQLGTADGSQRQATPNVAEYLDALRACLTLHVELGSEEWRALRRVVLLKDLDARGGSG